MEPTHHRLLHGDARTLPLPSDSVELVVTSPPYPMIELWDETFTSLDPAVGTALEAGDGATAFDRMHRLLDAVWEEVLRVLVPGGIAVVNVGDATRSVADAFARYPNAARVTQAFTDLGLRALPDIVWRKPANGPAKFVGSMRPPNTYVTLEHESILVFRNGDPRQPPADRRARSAYFFEERNAWFSDLWSIQGDRQDRDRPGRDRAAAFPVEIPYRLVNMYSVQGDTVLDPFCGTGTTMVAATASARHSVGVDHDRDLLETAHDRATEASTVAADRGGKRLADHAAFVEDRRSDGNPPAYRADHYDTRVVTARERGIVLPSVESLTLGAGGWRATHDRFER
ncbi:MAG: site-specific DNA-methyltransferase [Halobacteriaceae archaeon]